jgi:chemotaxis protein CheD
MSNYLSTNVSVFVKPGDLFISTRPVIMKTVLGSCISIVLSTRGNVISAMTHAQLSEPDYEHRCIDNCPVRCNRPASATNAYRYVTCSTSQLVENILTIGIKKEDIGVKIFGGADVISGSASKSNSVGKQNLEMAHKLIKDYQLKLLGGDTGGVSGRTVYFDTGSGTVWVKKQIKRDI